ncbi:hypothetical protein ACFL9U_06970 [Thermodesulfobacteriota bacterium]
MRSKAEQKGRNKPYTMILLAVFLLSLSSLAYEVLLARVFSISQWNHLAFMVISIALFGFAASGTLLSILDTRKKGWALKLSANVSISIFIVLFGFTVAISFSFLNVIPLDYFRLPLEPIQALYLLISYLLLALPFFFAGLVISLAYTYLPKKTGLIYFASMAGSACGAILPVPLLPLLGEGRLILLMALVPVMALPFALANPQFSESDAKYYRPSFRRMPTAALLAGVIIAVVFFSDRNSALIEVTPSPYKALSQLLQFPDTDITRTLNSMRGKIDKTKSPYIRFAPGLSLKFTDSLPEQQALFRDGDDQFTLYAPDFLKESRFPKYMLPYAGYFLADKPQQVLLIPNSGGSSIPCAMASGAADITIVVQNPQIARTVEDHYRLKVTNQNPRTYLARSQKQFHIIHVEDWGTSIPGASALTQQYFFTKEAFRGYLTHLSENGVLIISRKLLLPPADALRLFATAFESLRDRGLKDPLRHLALLRNWDVFTLLVSARPLNDDSLAEFARTKNFDLVFFPGIRREEVNRFNLFDEPYHFLEISRLIHSYHTNREKDYFRTYPLDITPQTDDRPFPSRFLKWTELATIYKSKGSRLYTLLMSGEIVVGIVFLEALGVASLMLILPLWVLPKTGEHPSVSQILFFLGVGAGFMFVELFFIKAYTLIFGDPVLSFTIVLAGILVFSGAGGICSQRLGAEKLRYLLAALIILLTILMLGFGPLTHQILGLSNRIQIFLAILLLLPPGFLMGLPFPIGMRDLLNSPMQRAFAWSTNGCASVLTSIISTQIAISLGISTIAAYALCAYLLVFFCTPKVKK